MVGAFSNWLDQRTGYKKFIGLMLIEHIPGGARWRYVWGSCLAFVFTLQVVTGVLLMTTYAPSDTSAWGSVYFIQYEMDFGWLIRGLHHFGSQTMVVLLAIHMLQVVIAGAHLPPREVNWWLGLLLLAVILGMGLTGYLLPWDQKGYYATQVATNIAAQMPGIGPHMQRFLVGGPTYGNATLTRFFTLHVWVLPITAIILIILHLVAFRRHGVTHPPKPTTSGWFYPDQAFRDLIVCLIIFGIMVSVVIFGGHGNKIEPEPGAEPPTFYESWAHAGKAGLGANLDAPADPQTEGYPARPEWYFLFLFQLLKYFPGDQFLIGAAIIPNGAFLLLFLLPLLGYGRMRRFGHYFGIFVVVALFAGVAFLTVKAMALDSPKPFPFGLGGGDQHAKDHQDHLHHAETEARRAVQMASMGIPMEGAREMLRKDPLTRGPRKFEANCAGCHSYTPKVPGGVAFNDPKVKFSASDLGEWGTEEWIRELLKDPGAPKFFGRTELKGMVGWRKGLTKDRDKALAKGGEKAVKEIDDEIEDVVKFLAQQALDPKVREERIKKDPAFEAIHKKGLDAFENRKCAGCHHLGDIGGFEGPDLTDYGSQEWIRQMIAAPYRHYDLEKNKMPPFRDFSGPNGALRKLEYDEIYKKVDENGKPNNRIDPIQLSDVDRELIIRWITHDDRAIFGGSLISGPPKELPKENRP